MRYFQPYNVLNKLLYFPALNLTEFLMFSVDFNMGNISGTTDIILLSFTKNNILYTPPEWNVQRSQIWRTMGQGMGFPFPMNR